MRFIKEPGKLPVNEEECATVFGDPDWVTLPPELGGARANVESSHVAGCPKCGRPGTKHLLLEGSLGVAECTNGCGFVWYRRRSG